MLTYRIDPSTRTVYFEGPAPTDPVDFQDALRAALADPAFRPGFGFLRDRRGHAIPSVEIVRAGAKAIAATPGMPTSKWAIVVDPGADYGMMRMLQLSTDGTWVEVALFHEPEEAKRWLGEPIAVNAER